MKTSPDLSTASTAKKSAFMFGLIAACGVLGGRTCSAETPTTRSLLEDTKLYATAPLRWESGDWMEFAGTVFALGIAHEFDPSVRHFFEPAGGQPLDGKDPNGTRDAIPALALLAGTWGFGVVAHDQAQRHEAWNMAEAAGFSAV